MVQQISLDPELWARTRRKAFDTRTTATKIVAEALVEYLDRLDAAEDRGSMAPKTNAEKLLRPEDEKAIDAVFKIPAAAKPLAAPPDGTDQIGAAAEIVGIVPLPKNATPEDVEQAVKQFATRPFSPVPKPTATKKAARR